jgi:hypothetical protein
MRKPFFGLSTVIALFLTFSVACKKDSAKKEDDCNALSQAVTDAATAYSNDPSTANCVTLKGAYTAYINSSCITDQEKQQAQQGLEMINAICP